MTGPVDFRRFRTWDDAPDQDGQPTWRILLRYGYVRLASSWPGRTLLILLAVGIVVLLGGASYGFASGTGVQADGWTASMVAGVAPLAAILLLVAAPLFADDLRFNAPLFYFSKPLRVRDYFAGKLAFLGSLVGAAVILPSLILLLLALLVGVPFGEPTGYCLRHLGNEYCTPAQVAIERAYWEATHIDSVAEWLAAAAVTIPGLLVLTAMFTSLAVLCSIYTQRGWHAGMAFVALVGGTSIAGGVLADSVKGSLGHLASPTGWAYLMVGLPMNLMFRGTEPMNRYEEEAVRNFGLAIPLAYLLALATLGLALWLSYARLSRQEARL